MIGDFADKKLDQQTFEMAADPGEFLSVRNHIKFRYICFPASVFHLNALKKYIEEYHGTESETHALNKLIGAVRKRIVEARFPVGSFDEDVQGLLSLS